MSLNNQKGFTLIELVVVTAIIGVVVAVAVPQYTAYKNRAYNTSVQASLRSLFTACQDYWTFNGSTDPCLLETVSDKGYGFVPSDTVEITISSDEKNTEYDFYATAHHTSSEDTFAVDFRGVVSSVEDEDGNNGNDDDEGGNNDGGNNGNNDNDDDDGDDDDEGNNGNGCSDEAHDNPHDLGGNAAGGCGNNGGGNGNGNGNGNGGGNDDDDDDDDN